MEGAQALVRLFPLHVEQTLGAISTSSASVAGAALGHKSDDPCQTCSTAWGMEA